MRRRLPCGLGPVVAIISATVGCARPAPVRYTVDALRHTLAARLSPNDANSVVVPFAVQFDDVHHARNVVAMRGTESERAHALIRSLSDPQDFGLVYEASSSHTASEALASKKGNCLSFAAVLVGLAREVGLVAVFAEFSPKTEKVQRRGDMMVRTGHITALVRTEKGFAALEFGSSVRFGAWRVISDVEATAHYYNNRGFESLHRVAKAGGIPSWETAAKDFQRAVRVAPEFARAWNNLGVAAVRLGQPDEALAHYRRALVHNPDSSSAYSNLGVLLLRRGDAQKALEALERAVALDPESIHAQYARALALWRVGRIEQSREATEEVLALDPGHAEALVLLDRLHIGVISSEGVESW